MSFHFNHFIDSFHTPSCLMQVAFHQGLTFYTWTFSYPLKASQKLSHQFHRPDLRSSRNCAPVSLCSSCKSLNNATCSAYTWQRFGSAWTDSSLPAYDYAVLGGIPTFSVLCWWTFCRVSIPYVYLFYSQGYFQKTWLLIAVWTSGVSTQQHSCQAPWRLHVGANACLELCTLEANEICEIAWEDVQSWHFASFVWHCLPGRFFGTAGFRTVGG